MSASGGGGGLTIGQTTSDNAASVVIASDQASIPVAATLQASSAVVGHVIVDAGTAAIGTVGVTTSTTATLSNVNANGASSVTVLASNANRKGAMIFNDSSASLYLKFGATASTTSFTVLIPGNGYYEVPGPSVYTGIMDGIWSATSGAARVTEVTA